MSVVLKGDIVSNFGRHLPAPFIRKVEVGDDDIAVTVSIFLNIDERQDVDSTIGALSNSLHLYLYLTADRTRFENISQGKKSVLEYSHNQEVLFITEAVSCEDSSDPFCQEQEEEITTYDGADGYMVIDNIFSSTSDVDGNISYDYLVNKDLYDERGTQIWEFRIKKTISKSGVDETDMYDKETLLGLWRNYYYRIYYDFLNQTETTEFSDYAINLLNPGFYVGAFSSTIDLNDEEQVLASLENSTLMNINISEVSYETVFRDVLANFYATADDDFHGVDAATELVLYAYEKATIPGRIQTEYLDSDGAIYNTTPLQSISGRYYKDNRMSHTEITDYFQEVIDQTPTIHRPRVKKMHSHPCGQVLF